VAEPERERERERAEEGRSRRTWARQAVHGAQSGLVPVETFGVLDRGQAGAGALEALDLTEELHLRAIRSGSVKC